MFIMTFLLVPHNLGQKMLLFLSLHRLRYTTSAPPIQEKKKKTHEKIETLLKHVIGNSGALLASFQ
jgi:hypothetical protein